MLLRVYRAGRSVRLGERIPRAAARTSLKLEMFIAPGSEGTGYKNILPLSKINRRDWKLIPASLLIAAAVGTQAKN